ncbi:hypothetical protein FRC20_000159 [Serendipita sp. 405]|nr:hypothetical protein FRC15_011773 [Serendipita sp. 397]KAG8870242.1 hypothetical protein FRC20_000159 [Serendipita sp. 405]
MSTEVISQCSPSNLRLALDAYEAEQQRQAALAEAQRIGHLIHLQEQQLVAARQLARQRKNNALRRQQQLQQVSMMMNTLEVLPECAIEEEEEEGTESSSTSSGQSASRKVATRRNTRIVSKRRSKRVSHSASSSSSTTTTTTSITPTEPASQTLPHSQPQPSPPRSHHHPNQARVEADTINTSIRFADWKRRPQEPSAHLCPRSLWKPDSHTTRCDNILCRTPFALWNGTKRHHCRRCGNVFCDACTSRTQVLYDMTKLPWDIIPEILLASLFKASDEQQEGEGEEEEEQSVVVDSTRATPELKSPSASSLSSSFGSGSSFGSQSYFEPRPTSSASNPSKILWELGSDYSIPMHLRMEIRDHVLDSAKPERVCDDCHDRLWGRDTPTDRYYDRRALQIERDEIAWALTVQGLDKWDDCLRSHGLTLKPTVSERREMRRAARRGSNVSSNTTTTTESGISQSSDSSVQPKEKTVAAAAASSHIVSDYLNRPIDTRMYAWPTPPSFIRFTTRALLPSPPSPPRYQPDSEPSIFGALKANPKYLPTRPMPPPPPPHIPTDEEMERERQERYAKAVEQFIYDAYEAAELLGPEFQRQCRVIMPRPLEWHQEVKDDLWRYAVDAMSWWRGDSYGGWH